MVQLIRPANAGDVGSMPDPGRFHKVLSLLSVLTVCLLIGLFTFKVIINVVGILSTIFATILYLLLVLCFFFGLPLFLLFLLLIENVMIPFPLFSLGYQLYF